MRPAETIDKLIKKLETKASAELDERVHSEISKALAKSEKTKSAKLEPNIWRIIMKSRITKLAAAAVIIIAVLIGINQFGGSLDIAGVAWADVVKNVEQIRTSIYRSKTSIEGLSYVKGGALQEREGFGYYSADYGMRRDIYENGKIIVVEHWIPAERAIVTVNPQAKTYSRRFFTEEEFRN